ncbi:hypothetical protein CBS101457_003153 [Exobasidium rhododendri]|nr:hypothetical protein CBS101457_003153 [Exobasidium rhododendri]
MNASSTQHNAPDSPFVDPDEEVDTVDSDDDKAIRSHDIDYAETASRPHAPFLRPTIPGLSSTVSSLSESRGVSTNNNIVPSVSRHVSTSVPSLESEAFSSYHPTPSNHTLMQMLNLVGNRYLEAEGNGMLPLEGEPVKPIKDTRDTRQSSSSALRVDRQIPAKGLRRGLFASQVDEDSTPRGGRSPLVSSLTANNDTTPLRTAPSRRFMSHTLDSSSDNDSSLGSQEMPKDVMNAKPNPATLSSTDSSQSDVSTGVMQMSIHALSTAPAAGPSRREELGDRLKSIFALEKEEEIVSCLPCWLFRGILLQGYIYVLTSHVCFYAYLPSREDRILKASTLRKRTKRTHRFSRHWAVLRGRALSWYESDKDPFFPQDHIDLRNVINVEVGSDARFNVETPYRTFTFEAESKEGALEWIRVLKRSVFRAQNEGESVRIRIPFEAIVDVDGSDASSLSAEWTGEGQDMVSIKVVNSIQSHVDFSMDEYFFLNLANPSSFVDQIRKSLIEYASAQSFSRPKPIVRDSTSSLISPISLPIAVPSKLRDDTKVMAASGLESQLAEAASFSSTPMPAPSGRTAQLASEVDYSSLSTSVKTIKSLSSSTHSYPPSPSKGSVISSLVLDRKSVLPQWVREASSKMNLSQSDNWFAFRSKLQGRAVREDWSASPFDAQGPDDGEEEHDHSEQREVLTSSNSSLFSVLEAPEVEGETIEADAVRQFKECFSLPDAEILLGHVSVSLYRVLPVTGRLYISTNYICFRSSRLASKAMGRTLMILPKREVISTAKNNAFRYGQHGLVIIVRGHEEVFLEFATTQRRNQSIALMDMQEKEDLLDGKGGVEVPSDRYEALLLTDLGQHLHVNERPNDLFSSQHTSPSLFGSVSSTFLAAKPKEDLHITFLTIGSRGDVQPYIAFAKGLKQQGHRVRIATHQEFQSWIESYDIEFKEVGGDPAELMRICVENGTFTMSFLRESMTKFRGWLDDLLISCWKACQGTDVVIESPSAIAGIHVAEALQVPYYRSFTMPWTRTRVYPHAFAVPGHKAGGNYNYMSYVIFDQVFWRASAGQINSWRKECLGLKATSLDRLEQHKVPFLYNFSPNLVPKPIDWYDWIHVTGFWFLDHADDSGENRWKPPEELLSFIRRAKNTGRKLVYIGWGSIVVSDAEEMTRTVLQAVKKSGVCAILSKGWSDRLQASESKKAMAKKEEVIDSDVFIVQSIPHDWLFPQLDAACHHGGSGTLGASLRAGIPTIVKPYFGDQFFWASQVESLHIGAFVRNFSVETFAEALKTCTSDLKMVENAKKIGQLIRAEDGVGNAIKAFYGDWEYACSRIPRDGRIIADTVAAPSTEKLKAAAISTGGPVKGTDVSPSLSTSTELENKDKSIEEANGDEEDEEDMDGWSVVSGSEEEFPKV